MWLIFSENMSYKGTVKGNAKKKRKQRYLPKGIFLVSDVQELFEYLILPSQCSWLCMLWNEMLQMV